MDKSKTESWVSSVKADSLWKINALADVYEETGSKMACEKLMEAADNDDDKYVLAWFFRSLGGEKDARLEAFIAQMTEKRGSEEFKKDLWKLYTYCRCETEYGTLQYYNDICRAFLETPEENRDAFYLFILTKVKSNMKETIFEYQMQLTEIFKKEFKRLCNSWSEMGMPERMAFTAAVYNACSQKILLPYKYRAYADKCFSQLENMADGDEAAAYISAGIAKYHFDRL